MSRRFLTVPLIFALALVAFSSLAQAPVGRLTSYDGAIEVLRGGIPLSLFPEMPLAAGDTLLTRDGRCTLRLADRTEVVLMPSSRLSLPGSGAAVDLGGGSAKITVPGNERVTIAAAGVLVSIETGSIEVAATKAGAVTVGVVGGGATLTTLQADGKSGSLRLLAGQMTLVSPNQPPSLPRSFESGSITSGARTRVEPKATPPAAPIPSEPAPVAPAPVAPAPVAPAEPVSPVYEQASDDGRQTQGKYAVQLIHALGIASALPPNATTQDAIDFLTRLGIEPCREDRTLVSPLLPFPHTGDLHVLDAASGQVLRFDSKGKVAIALKNEDILKVTGRDQVVFGGRALAFDATGAMYVTEGASASVLKRATEGSSLFALATAAQLGAGVNPTGLAFGGDGLLYVADEANGSILKLDPITGTVTATVSSSDLRGSRGRGDARVGTGIVGHPSGLELLSLGEPPSLLQLSATGVSSHVTDKRVSGAGAFITRGNAGEFVFANHAESQIFQIGEDQTLKLVLDKARLESAAQGPVGLNGGIVVDENGHLFIVDTRNNTVLRFDSKGNGEVWVTAQAIENKTKIAPVLGAAAFPNRAGRGGGWVAEREIELADLLCLAGIDPNDPNAPLTISLEEMIDRILERYGDLFWLQVRRKQSVSPFAP